MMAEQPYSDLICLVADKNIEQALEGLLSRPHSLAMRKVSYKIFRHPERDPGCLRRAHDFLRPFSTQYTHALVVLDWDGSGQESKSSKALEEEVESLLAQTGWAGRTAVIVLDPELEIWVWSDSPHVAAALGWQDAPSELWSWLVDHGFLDGPEQRKPSQPKEAMEKLLRKARKPRSSSIYRQLAQRVSFTRCTEPSFLRLRRILRSWFPR